MAFVTEKEKKKELKNNISNYMKLLFRRSVEEATPQQLFQAVSYAIKDIVVDDWMATHKAYEKKDVKTVYYLSMAFLMGRALGNMIINLKEDKVVREVLDEMGVNLDLLEDEEPDAALGNGGLGRLAACFLDSLSTLGYPAYGCGIRYKYGMFKQKTAYDIMWRDWSSDCSSDLDVVKLLQQHIIPQKKENYNGLFVLQDNIRRDSVDKSIRGRKHICVQGHKSRSSVPCSRYPEKAYRVNG